MGTLRYLALVARWRVYSSSFRHIPVFLFETGIASPDRVCGYISRKHSRSRVEEYCRRPRPRISRLFFSLSGRQKKMTIKLSFFSSWSLNCTFLADDSYQIKRNWPFCQFNRCIHSIFVRSIIAQMKVPIIRPPLTIRSSFAYDRPLFWYPSHQGRALKQLQDGIHHIDLVVEVRDARIPLTSINPKFESLFEARDKLIVYNKADLANPNLQKVGSFVWMDRAIQLKHETIK